MNDETPDYLQGEKPLHEYLRGHARSQPGKAALVWYGRAISYAELDRWSDAFAQALHERGVGKGDRVALFMQNCPQYLVAHFGIQKIGAIVSPCSPMFKAHEFAYQVGDLDAKALVVADHLAPIAQSVADRVQVPHVFSVRYADLLPDQPDVRVPDEVAARRPLPEGTIDFHAVLQRADPRAPEVALSMDDVSLMTYTSGTTGMPKGAMLSYRNALYKTAVGQEMFRIRSDDVMLAVAPLYHIAGMICGVTMLAYTGATVVLLNRMDALTVLQSIAQNRVSWWYAMAPMLVAAMNEPQARRFDLSSLHTTMATSFGIKLTEELAQRWSVFANGCLVYEAGYGLSETHTNDVLMPRDAVRWGTNGVPGRGVELKIIDAEGRTLPVGEAGEIAVRSQGVFHGYWNRPEATAEVLRGGWVHTGDIGRLDAQGYLTFIGRVKEMIKVSGFSVFPEEVESILILHPEVRQVAVIGVPDPDKGEVIKAFVVPGSSGFDQEALLAWARENMSHYKVPRQVEVRESLPASGTGKVLRRLLRQELTEP
ncbi:AMP-binding protein [Variovorax sp. Root473]|uniref:AMP-binding protein n=1 Tax=Variovorax sp. Root473 TaxID=1736541 RepID=UPI0006F76DFF|nr:AMP-binding protein [Variovorax sp. Root473]KQX94808.1 AMP-dependent synthetase [Variovorax sp. Root473]